MERYQKEVVSLEKGNKADLAAIREKMKQFAAAINAGDFEGWISLWTDDGIQIPPGSPARIGKEQIRAGMKPAFDQFILKIVINYEELRASGDLGFERGTFTETSIPRAGGETEKFSGNYLTVLERQADGSWNIIRDCFNSNVSET
jgi:uncharacterized protein (TIGR02246 family)